MLRNPPGCEANLTRSGLLTVIEMTKKNPDKREQKRLKKIEDGKQ